MKIHQHFLVALAACIILYPTTSLINLAAILAFGVLIDADHYLWYVLKFRSLNFKKAMKYFRTVEDANHILLPFHCVECFIPLLVLALYFQVAWYALLGFTIHMVLDLIQLKVLKPDKRNMSFVGWLAKK